MKVAVINFSGNVGKSTISQHLLAPRIPAPVIAVESINADESEDREQALRGNQFATISEAIMLIDDVVVDVGSSNVEDFMVKMKSFRGSHQDFDLFVVPTVPAPKQQKDTISTILALAEIGVPSNQIKLIFNQLDRSAKVEQVFQGLYEFHKAEGLFTLDPELVMYDEELYARLRAGNQSIQEILSDPTDLKEALKKASSQSEKLRISRQIGTRRLCATINDELDAVYKALIK